MMSRSTPSGRPVFAKLSCMMFLLFFVWGAWYVTMNSFMQARDMGDFIGLAYSVAPVAAILTPFIMGVFADRFVNAEKLQGILLCLGSVLICLAPQFASPEYGKIFIALLLGHTLCFMPTLGLSNTICLKHLANPDRDYPRVRVFATAGWIVAGLVVSFAFKAEQSPVQFYVAGAAGLAVGLYSFALPATPPPSRGQSIRFRELYGADTLSYFKRMTFTVFMFTSLLACVSMMPYWALGSTFANDLGIERSGGFFTMGQIAELFVLWLVLPVFIKRFGIKWTLLIGILSWIVRFVLFSGAAAAGTGGAMMTMMVVAVLLHGFSYDFVFVSGYLYVDRHVREEVRAQAQGLLVVFTQGIGFFLSSQIFVNRVLPMVQSDDPLATWKAFWMTPVVYLIVVFILFALLFREGKTASRDTDRAGAPV